MSHGPLMSGAVIVRTTWPVGPRIVSAPDCIALDAPPGAGRLPTTTSPPLSATSAVVNPTAGVEVGWGTTANTCCAPCGVISTMLDPVPCWFNELLKFETSTLPRCRSPIVVGTTATPYGFWSPVAGPVVGTAEATVVIVFRSPMNDPGSCAVLATARAFGLAAVTGESARPAAPTDAKAANATSIARRRPDARVCMEVLLGSGVRPPVRGRPRACDSAQRDSFLTSPHVSPPGTVVRRTGETTKRTATDVRRSSYQGVRTG